jgi:hypothetical protein
MFGYGPFETAASDTGTTWRRIPRWAGVALFGPWMLVLAWALAETFDLSPPWLFWVVIGSLVLGYASVLMACAYHVSAAYVSRLVTKERKPDA